MEEKQDEGVEAQRNKIILLGDRGTGKTSFARSLSAPTLTDESSTYINRLPIRLPTSRGEMILNIWDTGNPFRLLIVSHLRLIEFLERFFGGLLNNWYMNCSGVLIFFDVSSLISYKNVRMWIKMIRRYDEDVPLCICGNKV